MSDFNYEASLAEKLVDAIGELIHTGTCELSDYLPEPSRVETFAEAGVLTDNAGLVLTLADGKGFQITVTRDH